MPFRSPGIRRISAAFLYFFRQESAGGAVLLFCAAIAVILANSPFADTYEHILHMELTIAGGLSMSLLHWINDALMAVFFFVVGMEIKREFLFGELKSLSATMLPIAAAIGGMAVPALIYFAFNGGLPSVSGWAIPMSTDIAFSLGVLAFAAKGVPKSVAVFLTALAIVDDLGGIAVIALFYSASPEITALATGLAVIVLLAFLTKYGVTSPVPYLLGGIVSWYAFLQAGVHPTVAGVLVGFTVPAGTEETQEDFPLFRWEHALAPWSAFLVMPVFALGNAGIPLSLDTPRSFPRSASASSAASSSGSPSASASWSSSSSGLDSPGCPTMCGGAISSALASSRASASPCPSSWRPSPLPTPPTWLRQRRPSSPRRSSPDSWAPSSSVSADPSFLRAGPQACDFFFLRQ